MRLPEAFLESYIWFLCDNFSGAWSALKTTRLVRPRSNRGAGGATAGATLSLDALNEALKDEMPPMDCREGPGSGSQGPTNSFDCT